MEYRILRTIADDVEHGLDTLEIVVNQALADGWQVVGNVSVTTLGNRLAVITQAVQRPRPLPGNNRTTFVNNVDLNALNPRG